MMITFCLSGSQASLFVRFFFFSLSSLNYKYLQKRFVFFAEICWVSIREHLQRHEKKKTKLFNRLVFACRSAGKHGFTCRTWFWAPIVYSHLCISKPPPLEANSNHRSQSAHNKAALLCSGPPDSHVTRGREFMNSPEAGRQTNTWVQFGAM